MSRLGLSWSELGLGVFSALGIYAAVVVYTRVAGQRSLASMSTFDFAVSVAIGAVVGRVVLVRTSLLGGIVGLAVLFGLQAVLGFVRNRTDWGRTIDNAPILLLHRGRFLPDNLHRAHVGEEDVREQVRLQGVGRLADVHAVVLERSGGVSVITTGDRLDDELFANVVGWPDVPR